MRGATHCFLLWVALTGLPAGAAEYPIVIDPGLVTAQPSMRAMTSAQDLGSLVRGVSQGSDLLLQALRLEESAHPVIGRALMSVLLDVPVVLYAGWLQHEAFGHARACQDVLVSGHCRVHIAIPPPYGFNLGWNHTVVPSTLSEYQAISISSAGREAQQLLSDELVRTAYADGRWTRLGALMVLTQWMELTWETFRASRSNDLTQYYQHLAELPSEGPVTWGTRARAARYISGGVALLDPLPWFAAAAYGLALLTGRMDLALPDLWPGSGRGIIRPRLIETPHGPEWGLQSFAVPGQELWEAGIFFGVQPRSLSGTVYLEAPLPRWLPSTDLRLLLAGWTGPGNIQSSPGFATEVAATWWFFSSLGAHLRLGLKWNGYFLGRPRDAGTYAEAGLKLKL